MKTNLFLLPSLISFLSYTANGQALTANFSYLSAGACSSTINFTNLTTGGTPPYTYFWDYGDGVASNQLSPIHTYTSPGTYTVQLSVTDSFGNSDSTYQVVLVSGASPNIIRNPLCNGSCSGFIYYQQTSLLTFLWSNGSTTPNLQGICAGTYSVTITDTSANSCSDTFNLIDPPQITISASITPSCGGATGAIDITVIGGSTPYYYSWSNGANSPNLSGLPTGTYSITVSDSNQCTAASSFTIGGLILSFSSTAENCGAGDGSATVHALGGNGVYSYQWSPAVGTDSTITGLAADTYYVTVTDSSGCSGSDSVVVIDSCGLIKGHVFRDQNRNGIEDVGDNGMSGITVQLNGGQVSAVTNQNGDYTLIAPGLDTFAVSLVPPQNYYFYCSGTLLLTDSVSFPSGNLYPVIITSSSPVSAGNDFGLAPPSSSCGTISGYVFNDLNGNGVDDGEPRKDGISVRFSTGQYAVTDFFGMYSVEVPMNVAVTVSIASAPGSYFCGANQPYYVQTFPPFNGTYTVTLTSGSPTSSGNDFGVQQTSASFDVGIYSVRSFSGIYAGGTFTAWTDFKANGSISDTCRLRLTFNPLVSFVSAAITPTTVTGTYVEWAFPPGTAPSGYCMEMTFTLDSSATAGMQLIWTEVYYCGSPDGCPGNDTLTVTNTVQTGPLRRAQDIGFNFMEVEHTGTATGSLTTADSVFSYMIMFQNTGTDTAYHLTIVDTLSPHLNIQTISTPFSSNAYKLLIPASNILIWEFNNILLPDSATDFQHSYGFVQYNIHMKPNLSPGTRIEHRGAISFNYGEPYLTEKTSLIIKEPDDTTAIKNLSNDAVKIYPNPGSGIFIIELPKNFENAARIMVFDLLGTTMLDKWTEGQIKSELNLAKLPDGLYLVKLETENLTQMSKIILAR